MLLFFPCEIETYDAGGGYIFYFSMAFDGLFQQTGTIQPCVSGSLPHWMPVNSS